MATHSSSLEQFCPRAIRTEIKRFYISQCLNGTRKADYTKQSFAVLTGTPQAPRSIRIGMMLQWAGAISGDAEAGRAFDVTIVGCLTHVTDSCRRDYKSSLRPCETPACPSIPIGIKALGITDRARVGRCFSVVQNKNKTSLVQKHGDLMLTSGERDMYNLSILIIEHTSRDDKEATDSSTSQKFIIVLSSSSARLRVSYRALLGRYIDRECLVSMNETSPTARRLRHEEEARGFACSTRTRRIWNERETVEVSRTATITHRRTRNTFPPRSGNPSNTHTRCSGTPLGR